MRALAHPTPIALLVTTNRKERKVGTFVRMMRPRRGPRHFLDRPRASYSGCPRRAGRMALPGRRDATRAPAWRSEQTRSERVALASHLPRQDSTNAQLKRHSATWGIGTEDAAPALTRKRPPSPGRQVDGRGSAMGRRRSRCPGCLPIPSTSRRESYQLALERPGTILMSRKPSRPY